MITCCRVLGIFLYSLLFSVIVAIPFGLHGGSGYPEVSYCWWRGMWFGSSYAVLAYILFILLSVLYTLITGKDVSFKLEMSGHVICAAAFVAVVGSFVGMVSRNNAKPPHEH
jgi:hypothetical protein